MGGGGSKKRKDLWSREPGPSMLSRKDLDDLDDPDHEPRPQLIPSYLTMPFTMGGAEKIFWSLKCEIEPRKRTEEMSEAVSALRRVIREMELKEERLVFRRSFSTPEAKRADSPAPACESMKSDCYMRYPMGSNRAEEEREAASAKRREIREMELKEEQLAFIEKELLDYEPDPFFFPSERSLEFSLEEEREGSPALSCGSTMSYDSMGVFVEF